MKLTPYLFFASLSLVCNIVFCIFHGLQKEKITPKHICICALIEMIGIMLGAKLLDLVFHFDFYMECLQNHEWIRMLTVRLYFSRRCNRSSLKRTSLCSFGKGRCTCSCEPIFTKSIISLWNCKDRVLL